MDFGGLLRSIDQAIAAKNDQQVIDLCNQGIEEFNYSLLLAEKRGNARFNLKLYEDALVDFHNVLEAGINANECRLKICVMNSRIDSSSKRLQQESYQLIKSILIDQPTYKDTLITLFGINVIEGVNGNQGNLNVFENDVEFDAVIYKALNLDLRGLNAVDLYNHYRKHGIEDNRISSLGVLKIRIRQLRAQAPKAFSVQGYQFLNQDVQTYIESS